MHYDTIRCLPLAALLLAPLGPLHGGSREAIPAQHHCRAVR